MRIRQHSVLPGFGLTMGFTVLYLSLVVILPLSALMLETSKIPWSDFRRTLAEPEVRAAFRLSFGASLVAAGLDAFFGFIVAWVLVRYSFPGKRLLDAMVDLPFALPTAVSGIALTSLYDSKGWVGSWLAPLGIEVARSRLGVVVALMFIGLPFVVRTLQPALEDLDPEIEEASASLGAGRLKTFWWVILPTLLPAMLSGFALALARGLGEYGSVVFISGNTPMKTQIVPFLIIAKLNQSESYSGATVLAVVMLAASFLLLLTINGLQWWSRRYVGGG